MTIHELEKGKTYYNVVSGPGYAFVVQRNTPHAQWVKTRPVGAELVARISGFGRDPENHKLWKPGQRGQTFAEV